MRLNAWEWAKRQHVHIYDADGWRGPQGRPMEDEITEEEFGERLRTCTIGFMPDET